VTRARWANVSPELRGRLVASGQLNGCGPKNRWMNYLIPDAVFGLHLEESCYQHDLNYMVGHTEADRVKADWQFLESIQGRARAKTAGVWILLRPVYLLVAWVYYRAVRWFGRPSFHYADRERTLEEVEELAAKA